MGVARKKAKAEKAGAEWMSIPRAAAEIGKANATVIKLALQGELTWQNVAGRTFIGRESVAKYKARHPQK